MRGARVAGKVGWCVWVLRAAFVMLLGWTSLWAGPAEEEVTQDGPPGPPEGEVVPEPPLPVWAPADTSRLEHGMPWLARELIPGEEGKEPEGLFSLSRPAPAGFDGHEFFSPLESVQAEAYRLGSWERGILDPRRLLEESVRWEIGAELERWREEISHGVGLVVLDAGEILPGSEEWVAAWSPAFWPRPAVAAVYSIGNPGLSRLVLLNARAGSLAAVDLIELRAAALESARAPASRSGGAEEFLAGLGEELRVWERKGVERRNVVRAGVLSRMASLGGSELEEGFWFVLPGIACMVLLGWVGLRHAPGRWFPLRGLDRLEPAPPRFGGKAAGGNGAVLEFGGRVTDLAGKEPGPAN